MIETSQMTFAEQADIFLESLRTRRNRPCKFATISTWQSLIQSNVLPSIGCAKLESFTTKDLKEFSEVLIARKLSPRTIRETVSLVQRIVLSVVDEQTGDQIFAAKRFNMRWLDLPRIEPANIPAATPEQIECVLAKAPKKIAVLVCVIAATGMRLSECLAVRIADDGQHSAWLDSESAIFVRNGVVKGHETTAPKTVSGRRVIDVYPDVAVLIRKFAAGRSGFLFASRSGRPLAERVIRAHVPFGLHCLRRYRASVLRRERVHSDIIRYWLGHAPASMGDAYSRVYEDVQLRRAECFRAALGFQIPGRLTEE